MACPCNRPRQRQQERSKDPKQERDERLGFPVGFKAWDHGPQSRSVVAECASKRSFARSRRQACERHSCCNDHAKGTACRYSQTKRNRRAQQKPVLVALIHSVRNIFSRCRIAVSLTGPKYRLSKLRE